MKSPKYKRRMIMSTSRLRAPRQFKAFQPFKSFKTFKLHVF
jgi:hypothetical protein